MIIWYMCNTLWIPKASNTHSQYVTIIALPCNNGCMNAPECYILCTLPALFELRFVTHVSVPVGIPLLCILLHMTEKIVE